MIWNEIWKAAPPIVQAISIAVTAYFAVKSLRAWRQQLVGKRRFEIAEETIVAAYRVREALEWIRSPASWSGEATDRTKEAGETEAVAQMRDTYFVPLKRIKETSEDFSQLGKTKLLARIHFGEPAEVAIQELIRIRHQVSVAARMLVDHVGDRNGDLDNKFWEKLRWEIWATDDENDQLTPKISLTVKKIEEICTPYLK
jgi:hypothetical protein